MSIRNTKQKFIKNQRRAKAYERFLCQSPLFDPNDPTDTFGPFDEQVDSGRSKDPVGFYPKSLGSYHMLHYIDGQLMMVGVLDYTTKCMSSVYLYYDPKFEFLSPGTLSALREIEHVRKLMTTGAFDEEFKYYYMGLYYQDCQKSVYKANFKPCQLACPHTWKFVPLTDEVKQKIASERMPRLSEVDQLPVYSVDKKIALEKGLRAELQLSDG